MTLIVMSASMLSADELTVFWELPESGVQVRRSAIGEYFHIEGVPNCCTLTVHDLSGRLVAILGQEEQRWPQRSSRDILRETDS